MVIGLIGISMPVFWLGEVVNLVTQDRLHDSSSPGCRHSATRRSRSDPSMWFRQLLFPWITLSFLFIGFYSARAALEPARGAERGLRAHRALEGDQRAPRAPAARLRTSLIVFVSLFGLDFAALVGGGALLTEVVFGLPASAT